MGHNCGQHVITQRAMVFNAHRHAKLDPGCSLLDGSLLLSLITETTLNSRFCNWQYIQLAVMLYRVARFGKAEFKALSVRK